MKVTFVPAQIVDDGTAAMLTPAVTDELMVTAIVLDMLEQVEIAPKGKVMDHFLMLPVSIAARS